ncbi:hypothetical protein MLD38_037558 [Melastoma candidum]|uniref:Uncharacterized protein n=1 Tax=Melastoma candidum TaxID=119954 RepID=A0ACB9LNE1_9MYRT|nr:hypothetical protein MLD38_037558 [Melastoma candidum]
MAALTGFYSSCPNALRGIPGKEPFKAVLKTGRHVRQVSGRNRTLEWLQPMNICPVLEENGFQGVVELIFLKHTSCLLIEQWDWVAGRKAMEEGKSNNEVVPPLNFLLFVLEPREEEFSQLTLPDLCAKLRAGVVLKDKREDTETLLFWMDGEPNMNCFMLLPKSLRINTDGNGSPSYVIEKQKLGAEGETSLETVKYERKRHLRVGGKLEMLGLSPKGKYEVVLYLKLIQTGGLGSMYSASTKKMSVQDGNQTREPWELVGRVPLGEWYPFPVGKFQMKPNYVGELSFEIQVYFWGRPDIMIKGVAIKPPIVKL